MNAKVSTVQIKLDSLAHPVAQQLSEQTGQYAPDHTNDQAQRNRLLGR